MANVIFNVQLPPNEPVKITPDPGKTALKAKLDEMSKQTLISRLSAVKNLEPVIQITV